jgi:type VI protein secretion system component Hcp
MAGNIYLHLDGVPGESTATHFINWIDVASFSVGCAMEIDPEARTGSGGGTSGAADPEDFSIEKKMSWASPMLLLCCASGAIISQGRLVQCNVVNELILPVSDYAFSDAIVTSVSLSGSGGGIPDESVTLAYGSIIWQYHCYSHTNPSQEVGHYHKEWSVISAKPGKADPNALDVFSSINANSTAAYSAAGKSTFKPLQPVAGNGPQ